MPDAEALQAFLARQSADYRASLAGRLDTLEQAWRALEAAPHEPAPWRALERCAHGIAGSAGTFGLAGLGAVALELELACEVGPGAGATELAPLVATLAGALREAAREG